MIVAAIFLGISRWIWYFTHGFYELHVHDLNIVLPMYLIKFNILLLSNIMYINHTAPIYSKECLLWYLFSWSLTEQMCYVYISLTTTAILIVQYAIFQKLISWNFILIKKRWSSNSILQLLINIPPLYHKIGEIVALNSIYHCFALNSFKKWCFPEEVKLFLTKIPKLWLNLLMKLCVFSEKLPLSHVKNRKKSWVNYTLKSD